MDNRYKLVQGMVSITIVDTLLSHQIAIVPISKKVYAIKIVTFLNIEHDIEQEVALLQNTAIN